MEDSSGGGVLIFLAAAVVIGFGLFHSGKADGGDEARAELTPARAWSLYLEAQDKATAEYEQKLGISPKPEGR